MKIKKQTIKLGIIFLIIYSTFTYAAPKVVLSTPDRTDYTYSGRDEIITGNWVFSKNVTVNDTVTASQFCYHNGTCITIGAGAASEAIYISLQYVGDNLTGASGAVNRVLDDNGDMLVVDNQVLHPVTDYTNTSTNTTFLNPIWDDQRITLRKSSIPPSVIHYTGIDATGIDGAQNRTIATGNITFVVVDNQMLHEGSDYSMSGSTMTFLNHLWNDMRVTTWA